MAGINKSSDAIFDERVIIVMEMVLAGLKRREILQNISDSKEIKWNVTERQIDNYLKEANKIISESTKEDREKLIAKAFAKYEFIYRKLIYVKDYKAAIAAIEKSAALLGLNAPTKAEVAGTMNFTWNEVKNYESDKEANKGT